jgi:hypothetical protein
MKTYLVALLVFAFSTSAFARQYIQCSTMGSSDVMVVNLQTEEGGTLFISSGMENPEDERTLVKIQFDKLENGKHFYRVINENNTGSVAIPSELIGKSANSLFVDLIFSGYSFQFSCFSRIYND